MRSLSRKPGKQRKALFAASSHKRGKGLSAPLSPELREKHGTRSLRVKKGDTVIIMRGEYTGIEGKIMKVDPKSYRVRIEGITREKVDGTTVFVPIHPSKVMIKRLNLDDQWRKDVLERKTTRTYIEKKTKAKTRRKK